MKKPRVSKLKMLAEGESYCTSTTKEDNSKSPPCRSTKPRVSLSRPSRNWKLIMLADVAAAMSEHEISKALEREEEEEEEARLISVNVPRKKRTHRSHHRSSSMATQWTRVIEKQRSVELKEEEEERSLKKRKMVRRFEVGSSSSRHLKEESRVPQNPNPDLESSPSSSCVTINVSKEEEEERSCKKRKIVVPTQTTTPPEWLVNVTMREDNGYDPKLIIARKLFQSDLDKVQSRLSMPLNQVVSSDFLTEEEARIIYEQSVLKIHKEGVSVVLVDPLLNKHVVDLRKWKMSGNWNYVFVDGWNDVVAKNTFKVHDVFHVWSFRSGGGKLCFALVPPPTNDSCHGGSTSGESGHGCSPPA